MKTKLENLLSFDDFKSNWNSEQSKKTKRTETGLDILKEDVEKIIPEGLPDDIRPLPELKPKFGLSYDEKVEEILSFLEDDADDEIIQAIVNELRDVLLEMEQQGFVDEETTDELDELHNGDWISWIADVIQLPDFPEEGVNNVYEIISNPEYDFDNFSEQDEEDEENEEEGDEGEEDEAEDLEDYSEDEDSDTINY